MKEKIKNYLFCLCALAMCLAFALAVFFRASKSLKAAALFDGGDITVNEGQSLISNDTTQGRFVGQLNYNGTYYVFSYFKYSNTAPTYINYLTSCISQSSTSTTIVLSCSYGTYLSMGTSRTSSIANFVVPTLTISHSDINNANDTLTISNLPYTNGPNNVTDVVFTTRGISYSDGFNVGYNNARLQLANELYYYACLQNENYVGTCSSSYFTPSPGLSVSYSTSYILQEILLVAGSNSTAVPVGVYDYIKTKYSTTYSTCLSYSLNCVSWSSNALTIDNLQLGVDTIQTNIELVADYISYNDGYSSGRIDGESAGFEQGKAIGYEEGFFDGQENEDIVGNAVLAVASTPLMVLSGMLNFDILGFNLHHLVLALFTSLLVIYIIKKVLV